MCGDKSIWEISVTSPQFCCEPTAALKKKISLMKKATKRRANQTHTKPKEENNKD